MGLFGGIELPENCSRHVHFGTRGDYSLVKWIVMSTPFFQIWNMHNASCGEPPTITNEPSNKYYGYFQNRFGEQWVFVYDPERKIGELRGGDIGWGTVVVV